MEELIRQSLSKGLIEEKEVHLQMGCFDQGLFYWYWALEHDFLKIFRRYPGRAWEIWSSLPSDHEEMLPEVSEHKRKIRKAEENMRVVQTSQEIR